MTKTTTSNEKTQAARESFRKVWEQVQAQRAKEWASQPKTTEEDELELE